MDTNGHLLLLTNIVHRYKLLTTLVMNAGERITPNTTEGATPQETLRYKGPHFKGNLERD